DRETGEAQAIQVVAHSGISDDEIARMMADAADYMAQRRAQEAGERARQGIEVLLAELDRLLPDAEARLALTPIASTTLTKARQMAEHVRRVSRDSDPDVLAAHARELQELTEKLRNVR